MSLKDKTAIVTGGARGIGECIARRLASDGANIIIWDVQQESASATAEAIAKDYGVKTLGSAVNVTSSEGIDEAVKAALATFGTVEMLVNNAGLTRDNLTLRMSEDDWDLVLNVNLKGAFLCTKAVGRHMLKSRFGRIVNIASVVGQMGNPGQANYSASKAGLIGLTKTTSKEFASRGVTVNAVAPGYIRTAMTDALSEEVKDQMKANIPLGSFGEVDDVAAAVHFLVSENARYVTGQVLAVNGGMYM